jgi:tRNA A22 N-methylase
MNEYIKHQIKDNLHDFTKGKVLDLTAEALSIEDHAWLATELIKKSSVIETVLLPEIAKEDIEAVIAIFHEATTKNSTLTALNFDLSVLTEGATSNAW